MRLHIYIYSLGLASDRPCSCPHARSLRTHTRAQLYPSCANQYAIGGCCGQGGSSTCGCVGTFCQFRRVVQNPLVWEATLNKQRCACA